jgi:hypothetical protein
VLAGSSASSAVDAVFAAHAAELAATLVPCFGFEFGQTSLATTVDFQDEESIADEASPAECRMD